MNKSKGLLIAGIVFAFVQAVVSVMTLYRILKFDALPGKYEVLLVAALIVGLILVVGLQFFKIANIIGDIIAILIIGVLIYAYVAVSKVDKVLEEGLKPSETVQLAMNVMVKNDSPVNSIDDLLRKKFGISTDVINVENNREAIKIINSSKNSNVEVVEYEDNFALSNALLKGEIDCIILNGAYIQTLNEAYDALEPEDDGYLGTNDNGRRIEFEEMIRSVLSVSISKEAVSTGGFGKPDDNRELIDTAVTPFIIYVSGIDVSGPISTVSRSDVNVLVAVNPVTKQIAMITTPRDSYVEIPGITDENRRDKLTHAGAMGVQHSIETLEKLYGIDIDYYVRVNFSSVVDIVDLLGGVSIYSAYDFTERFSKHHFVQGYNHNIDGKTALYFARERYTLPGGDYSRGRNHIELIKGILNKAMSPAILTNYAELLSAAEKNIETNMTKEEIVNLIKMQLADNQKWNFSSLAAEDGGGQKLKYVKTYSGSRLYVSILTQESVEACADLIELVLNGGIAPSDVSQ